jgi:hypothetical protein
VHKYIAAVYAQYSFKKSDLKIPAIMNFFRSKIIVSEQFINGAWYYGQKLEEQDGYFSPRIDPETKQEITDEQKL